MDEKIKLYLSLIIKHFKLEDETIESLYDKFEHISEITSNKIRFDVGLNVSWGNVEHTMNKIKHNYAIDMLKKYANEEALNKYMENESFKYKDKIDLGTIIAKRFIIYPMSEALPTHNYVKRTFKSSYDMWEFEHIENTNYGIAYN